MIYTKYQTTISIDTQSQSLPQTPSTEQAVKND